MKWIKRGLVFKTENNFDWMQTHAQVPIVEGLDDDTLRIYFGVRNKNNKTMTTFVDVDASCPSKVLYMHQRPILSLGKLGCFDEDGVMPSDMVVKDGTKFFYYVGWNVGMSVRYRVANGLAIDSGGGFCRVSDGPIMDRDLKDPISVSTQCVIVDNNLWKAWYMSFVKWEIIDGISEPFYNIKYAESTDGVVWDKKNIVCIDLKSKDEAGISRPSVIKDGNIYKMWYSMRGLRYRYNKSDSYKIGYAESFDGISWIRKDDEIDFDVSKNGWDSQMVAYPYVYKHKAYTYMFYNGNDFGKSGFGYATLE